MSPNYRRRESTEAIIIHHTATSPDASVDSIRAGHLRRPGWIDIGYNWLVRHGQALRGRPDWSWGAHAPGWNRRAVGVALVGDYSEEYPPPEQLLALRRLCAVLLRRYPGARILGHSEAMEEVGKRDYTTCPGSSGWLGRFREALAASGLYGGTPHAV